MRHSREKLLSDILAAGRAIATFTTGRTRADFDGDLLLRSGVERQFEILGEALRRLKDVDPVLADRIGEHRRIIAFRNLIAHGYDGLDNNIVWQAIEDKLPVRLAEAAVLLAELMRT